MRWSYLAGHLCILQVAAKRLSLDGQLEILQAGIDAAEELGVQCALAIGASGGVLSLLRMDGASLGSLEVAQARQRMAAAFQQPTLALANATAPGGRFFDLQVLSQGGDTYMSGPGGLPLPSVRWMSVGVDCGVTAQDASQTVALRAVASSSSSSSFSPSPEVAVASKKRRIPRRRLASRGEERGVGCGLTLNQATALALQGVEAGRRADVPLAVAVLDTGAHPKVLLTMDGVPTGFAAAAVSKARAARLFDGTSEGLNDASQPGTPAYGVQLTNGGLFTVPGAQVFNTHGSTESTQIAGSVGLDGPSASLDVLRDLSETLRNAALHLLRDDPPLTLRDRRGVTSGEAQAVVNAALQARSTLSLSSSLQGPITPTTPGAYAVVDATGRVRAQYVEDGAEGAALDIAVTAARTSAAFHVASAQLGPLTRPPNALSNVELLGYVGFESAEVLRDGQGRALGAIGVSGTGAGNGTGSDGAIARAAASALLTFSDPCALSPGRCHTPLAPLHVPSPPSPASSRASLRRRPPKQQAPITTTACQDKDQDREVVSLEVAWGLMDAVLQYSNNAGQKCCIAVLDTHHQVKAQVCEDDSFMGAVDLAPRKAKTALLFGRPNQELQQAQLDALYKVETTSGGLFMNAGGVPLLDMQDSVVGAVGVAGAQDDAVAVEYAQKAWEDRGL